MSEGPLLEVRNLKKYFETPMGMLHAVDDVSFELYEGKTLGVVGESGCGKSTLGRTILQLLSVGSGQIIFDGRDITNVKGKALMSLRRQMQIIFQDPFSSLDPRMSVSQLITDPIRITGLLKKPAEISDRVSRLMEVVGLDKRLINAYPHELDGGRRQRIGVARALALNPKFIVCDEPVSALDVSIQAQILNLLMDLKGNMGLTYIFITHDLSVVKHISDTIVVMYLGQVIESSPTKELFSNPLHPYTQGLLSAIPVPKLSSRNMKPAIIKGEVTNPIEPKPGCRFAPRCPKCGSECTAANIAMKELSPNHFAACVKAG
jgi:oligopeptide/dipeptide ABC transporter ATP-binding protein